MPVEWLPIAWSKVVHVINQDKPNRTLCGLHVPEKPGQFKLDYWATKYERCKNCERMLEIKKITGGR